MLVQLQTEKKNTLTTIHSERVVNMYVEDDKRGPCLAFISSKDLTEKKWQYLSAELKLNTKRMKERSNEKVE